MDAPEEPLPPVIYTMENKPIVTCECRSAGRGRRPLQAARPRLAGPSPPRTPPGHSLDGGVAGRRRRRASVPRATSDPVEDAVPGRFVQFDSSARCRRASQARPFGLRPPQGPSSRPGVVLSSGSHRSPTPGRALGARRRERGRSLRAFTVLVLESVVKWRAQAVRLARARPFRAEPGRRGRGCAVRTCSLGLWPRPAGRLSPVRMLLPGRNPFHR